MDTVAILIGVIAALLLLVAFLTRYILRSKRQLKKAGAVLDEIAAGNPNRRILAEHGNMAAVICYKINEIVITYREKLLAHEKSEQAYKQLVTSLSHDIRTPLATLTGYLEALSDGIVTGTEKEEYLLSAVRKAAELRRYVDMLFEWLKLESGERTYRFEQTDICEMSRNVIADFVPVLEARNMAYAFHIPETAIQLPLDRSAYVRILSNLMENAVEHSNGTQISVSLTQKESAAVLCVSDNGKGIAAADLPYVFDRLFRCDDARTGRGNGLGLSIVKELVKAHGGSVCADSVPDTQTILQVRLPLSRA